MSQHSCYFRAPCARRPLSIAVAAALGWLCASQALAQQTEASLKETTVTGSVSVIEEAREVSTLGSLTMDKPMAGSVLTREDLDIIKSASALTELMSRVPGVSKSRNMRISAGGKNYTDNRVDGLRVSPTGTYSFVDQTNAADIDRIEFINGPGSVLQSSYAIGGTINVITRDPPKKRAFSVSQEVGSSDFYRTDLSGGDTLDNGFGYVFDANVKRDNAWRERAGDNLDAFSIKFGGKPDAASSLYVRLEYLNDETYYPGQLTQAQFDADWQQAQPGVYGKGTSRYVTPSIHYQRAVGEKGEFVFAASRRVVDTTTFGNTATYTSFSNTIGVSQQTVTSSQAMYRQEFDVMKSRLDVGVEYLESVSDSTQYANTFSIAQALLGNFAQGALNTKSNNSESTETSTTPFVNYEFSPTDKLRLHAGVRLDSIDYAVDDRSTSNKDNAKTFTKAVPKLGATYEFNANNLMWVSYAEGFLAPSVSTLLSSGTVGNLKNYVPASDLLPEEMKTYEIGFRGYLPASKLRYDVTVYKTDIVNMVLQRDCYASESCYRINENVGQMTAKGIETGLSASATPWLDLGVSHTLASANYGYYKSATYDYSGKSNNFTPKHHLNVRATFKPAPGWKAELEANYESEYYLDAANSKAVSQPAIYNLRASYTDPGKRWSAWLHLLNLANTKYATRMSGSADAWTYNDGYTPLTVRAGVQYNF
ncbi:TonB-dependent receptor [Rhodoferax sp.]|uniref:TonB-dependent receptor n=1 Tax=Rhodoferax sp. TaxID=50421 RepID=UPI00284DE3FE|nr:TonB-dependent receptor [Rhodoferax sp.]MDR3369328.1 TonB-dependent receptor [Rhodoferax sp.]